MLGSGKTPVVRAFAMASSSRIRDATLCRRYTAAQYRQAQYRQAPLTRGDLALTEHVVGDVIVGKRALAASAENGSQARTPAAGRP